MKSTTLLALATFLRAQALPMTASHLVTGTNSHVELTNTGNQPITAWSLAVITPAGSGRTHRVVETVDAYLSEVTRGLPGSTERTDRLLPGQSRTLPLDPLPGDATVEIVAVVLEDKTALGDAEIIKSIFDRRAMERDELHRVVDILNEALKSKRGVAALEELKNRFSAPASNAAQQGESTPRRAAREAVESYLRMATAGNAEAADQGIREYAALVERQYALAVRHSRD